MESGVISRWLAAEGDAVERGQILAEVETDKAVAELESPASGFLRGVRATEGSTVLVGATIAYIADRNEPIPEQTSPAREGFAGSTERGTASPVRAVPRAAPKVVLATPVARRVAKELGLDLDQVRGSGPEGRITEQDVRSHAQAGESPSASGRTSLPASSTSEVAGRWLDLSPIQLRTGQRMMESAQTAPQFSLTTRVDATELLAAQDMVAREDPSRGHPSITAMLVRLMATALGEHPIVNSSFEGGRLRVFDQINIAVATATSAGLVAPVIHDANRKSLIEIADELAILKGKAKGLRLTVEDLAGATFTLSNLGMYAVDQFVALLNPPQSAILAVGRIRATPAGLPDGSMALRPLMALTLTVDHRSLDGAQAAVFLSTVQTLIEAARF
jgi:pyruvate dehydrogenase E2 component (dihydrolipoamide acetyltransferase)